MVLSRLRHPAISRATSLLRARLFASSVASSSRSLGRISNGQCCLGDKNGACMRSLSVSMVKGIDDCPPKLGLRHGVRHLSSAESAPHTVLRMPALSPTMTQGNIAKWRKKEGDKIEVGDVLCEIETDKATLEFESLEEGYLAKIIVAEGSKDVIVQEPIAIMVEEEDDIQNVPATLEDGLVGKEETSTRQEIKQEESMQDKGSLQSDTSDLPPHIVLAMPALSPTMDQGNITKWRKKEGDKIEVGDIICEIETDKATLEFESLEEGYLARILVPEGSKDVAVGKPIALIVEDAENIEAIKSSSTGGSQAEKGEQARQGVVDKPGDGKPSFTKISPAAKLLISEYGLEASSLKASGPRGTLLKTDVLAAIASGNISKKTSVPTKKKHPSKETRSEASSISLPETKSTQTQSDNYIDLPNSQIRKVIARRLLESKQNTPHLYLQSDVVLDPLLAFRKELQEKHDIKVSVNDIVIKAVAVALRNVQQANAFWNAEKGGVVLCETVDISIAVATEKGLMTPIIRNADQKSISAISAEVKELAQKARAGKLAPHEFQGGTFSISNLGMYPVDHFCAIINPPQAGILAIGRGNKVVEPMITSDGIEKPSVVTKMSVTLSADHRVFDGQVGAAFFSDLRSNFADVRRLLL